MVKQKPIEFKEEEVLASIRKASKQEIENKQKRLCLEFPVELMDRVDAEVMKEKPCSRTAWIARAMREKLERGS